MAELRDRYNSHGFDEKGNDNNMKVFEKATKQLLEFSKTFPKELQKRDSKREQEYIEKEKKRDLEDKSFRKALRDELGNAAKKTLGDGLATVVQATIGGAGPIGYLLEKTLNLSGVTKALVDNFGSRRGGISRGLSSQEITTNRKLNDTKKADRENFESYPTIVKLRAWLNFQTKDNALFRKYMISMQNRAKEQAKFEKEQSKLKKVFEKMQKGIDKQALLTSAMVAGITLGVFTLVGLSALVGTYLYRKFGNTQNSTAQSTPGAPVINLKNKGTYTTEKTSGYGRRPPVVDKATGKVVSPSGMHHGIDMAAPSGASVRSLTPGKAYPWMQLEGVSGFVPYKKEKPEERHLYAGYGNFVDVVCTPITAERLGFPGRTVTIRYAHLLDVFVSKGATVQKGQIIGSAGRTGGATGTHVHIEVLVDGKVMPPGSLGTQYGVDPSGNLDSRYTVDPDKLKFFDSSGKLTNASGAFKSWASVKVDPNKPFAQQTASSLVQSKQSKGTFVDNPGYESGAISGLTEGGFVTGGAANISMVGKNESLMQGNNITNANAKKKQAGNSNQPILIQTPSPTPEKKEENIKLSFDVENSATKLLKHTDRTIDFGKV